MKRLGKLLKCFEYLVVAEKPRGSAVRAARPWNTLYIYMYIHLDLHRDYLRMSTSIYGECRRGPKETMKGDWKHWRRQVEEEKDSREDSLS